MKAITCALVEAQRAFGPLIKNKTNPHFGKRYADLHQCYEVALPALNAAGIAVVQGGDDSEPGHVTVTCSLLHTSGERIDSRLTLPLAKADPQAVGSAVTYGRRYLLCAMIGLAPEEDDDANAASSGVAPAARPRPARPAPTQGANVAPAPGGDVVRFGRDKGTPLGLVRDLTWYRNAIATSIADPAKERFRSDNEAHLAAIDAAMGGAVESGHDDSNFGHEDFGPEEY